MMVVQAEAAVANLLMAVEAEAEAVEAAVVQAMAHETAEAAEQVQVGYQEIIGQ